MVWAWLGLIFLSSAQGAANSTRDVARTATNHHRDAVDAPTATLAPSRGTGSRSRGSCRRRKVRDNCKVCAAATTYERVTEAASSGSAQARALDAAAPHGRATFEVVLDAAAHGRAAFEVVRGRAAAPRPLLPGRRLRDRDPPGRASARVGGRKNGITAEEGKTGSGAGGRKNGIGGLRTKKRDRGGAPPRRLGSSACVVAPERPRRRRAARQRAPPPLRAGARNADARPREPERGVRLPAPGGRGHGAVARRGG